MKLSTRKMGNVIIIDVDGKIVLDEGDVEIKKTVDNLLERGNKSFLLNLAKVPYLDSSRVGRNHPLFYGSPEKRGKFQTPVAQSAHYRFADDHQAPGCF